jgi:hypothetical protein
VYTSRLGLFEFNSAASWCCSSAIFLVAEMEMLYGFCYHGGMMYGYIVSRGGASLRPAYCGYCLVRCSKLDL